jgi:hypothetical protein
MHTSTYYKIHCTNRINDTTIVKKVSFLRFSCFVQLALQNVVTKLQHFVLKNCSVC